MQKPRQQYIKDLYNGRVHDNGLYVFHDVNTTIENVVP